MNPSKDPKKKKTLSTVEKQPQNKLKTIRTSDGKEFKVLDSLLMKFSLLLKTLIEDEKNEEEPLVLTDIDSESFDMINQFMQLHKDKEISKIEYPLKSNQDIRLVLEEPDAYLVEKIMAKGDEYFVNVFNACSFLQVEDFKKRLIAGLAIKLMKKTVGELKEEYGIVDDIKQEEIREDAQRRLKLIADMKDQ